jgi:hypothetical protein
VRPNVTAESSIHVPEAGTAAQPVSRHARVIGEMSSRQGDGSLIPIPRGPCGVRLTALDATLSWTDGASHGPAAMPLTDFRRHLAEGRIAFTDEAAPGTHD